jgi:hypothetical protein
VPHQFAVPKEAYDAFDAKEKGRVAFEAWNALLARYRAEHPQLAADFERRVAGHLPPNWKDVLPKVWNRLFFLFFLSLFSLTQSKVHARVQGGGDASHVRRSAEQAGRCAARDHRRVCGSEPVDVHVSQGLDRLSARYARRQVVWRFLCSCARMRRVE